MKLEELKEARYNSIPFSVTYEKEMPGEDYETVDVVVTGVVMEVPDAYSTGDSPTDYEVQAKSATVGGKPFDMKQLDDSDWEAIDDMAIASVTR